MRKVKLQLQVTVDGFMGGPNGELDWMTMPWSDDLNAFAGAIWQPVGTIVLGRNLAEGFIPAWASGPEGETQETIDKMNNTPKVVVSRSLTESPWENAVVAGGDLGETIEGLRREPGGDIITCGGSTLAQDMIARDLVDELYLFVNPVAIGAGLAAFPEGTRRLRLVAARPFECGITVLHYEPKRS